MMVKIRPLHFLSPMILWIAILSSTVTSWNLPHNIIQKHIAKSANFSVDPCDDFYLHVCPDTQKSHFMDQYLLKTKQELIERVKSQDEFLRTFSRDALNSTKQTIEGMSAQELMKMCNKEGDEEKMNKGKPECFGKDNCNPLKYFASFTCASKVERVLRLFYSDEQYEIPRNYVIAAVDAMIMSGLNKDLDVKARKLFETLRSAVSKEFKRTPWALKNDVLQKYEAALEKLQFHTFSEYSQMVYEMLQKYRVDYDSCREEISGSFIPPIEDIICEVLATKNGYKALKFPANELYDIEKHAILRDTLNLFVIYDKNAYVGNDFMLLLNTNRTSDMYGGLGYALLHELMHPFVFDKLDFEEGKTLAPYWTKNADCVAEQAMKTCENFPASVGTDRQTPFCNTSMTFEEDAADIAAYRIAYKAYQRSFQRKTVVDHYEDLNAKQLFFYGAAVIFCKPNGRKKEVYTPVAHSNDYQRVTSLMSQMDEFAEAFQCKPTDKMVRNKATHCAIYGADAPN